MNNLTDEELYILARTLKEHCQNCEKCCFEVVTDNSDGNEETRCRINGLLPCDWEV